METESEKLFEKFCTSHRINYIRISTSSNSGEQRPDYKLQARAEQAIYVEIKQFDPNHWESAALEAAGKHPHLLG